MSKIELPTPGLVHLYAGDGKGKTTAAVGLCLRARGHGWRVLFCQFLKARGSGELSMLEQVGVDTLRAPASLKFTWDLTGEEKSALLDAHKDFLHQLENRLADYDLVVLDEVVDAVHCGFVPFDQLKNIVKNRPLTLEIVLTGHNPSGEMTSLADYYTDFRCIRHPFQNQVAARKGIES